MKGGAERSDACSGQGSEGPLMSYPAAPSSDPSGHLLPAGEKGRKKQSGGRNGRIQDRAGSGCDG
ncbi:hypothetical protein DB728_05185 [Rhizobium leguminosarum bv. viciae USDA 2370]|nr:hypothetical protein DB728_05185 [Rhizobium leguminosarum bv. viciae USDA 2370]